MKPFLGAFYYEFLMQVRRPAVWIIICFIAVLTVSLYLSDSGYFSFLVEVQKQPPLANAIMLISIAQYLLPICVGCLLADRLVHDRKTRVEELLTTMPTTLSARLLGKYCGSLLATLLPILLLLLSGATYIYIRTAAFPIYPLTLLIFLCTALPGLCFVAAFSLACPRVIWIPLYQFLFIGYWFWGNMLDNAGIPTLSSTILTPLGGFIMAGLFGHSAFVPARVAHATLFDAIASITVLLILASLVLGALIALMNWQQTHQ
jgi:hypothetical protein